MQPQQAAYFQPHTDAALEDSTLWGPATPDPIDTRDFINPPMPQSEPDMDDPTTWIATPYRTTVYVAAPDTFRDGG